MGPGLDVVISTEMALTAVLLGGAVAVAPLLTSRRLRRMDIQGRCASWSDGRAAA